MNILEIVLFVVIALGAVAYLHHWRVADLKARWDAERDKLQNDWKSARMMAENTKPQPRQDPAPPPSPPAPESLAATVKPMPGQDPAPPATPPTPEPAAAAPVAGVDPREIELTMLTPYVSADFMDELRRAQRAAPYSAVVDWLAVARAALNARDPALQAALQAAAQRQG